MLKYFDAMAVRWFFGHLRAAFRLRFVWTRGIRPGRPWILAMTVFKSGDLVTLKSGGPTMTVDTVNTDILDDNKITGVLCVWFVGEKLERVRFDHRAIQPASAPSSQEKAVPEEVTGE